MRNSWFLAALCVVLPACAATQQGGPAVPPCGVETPPARAALPARATTAPQPQLGSVAPGNRVPSGVDTPSMRAMRAASARKEGADTAAAEPDCSMAGQVGAQQPEPGKKTGKEAPARE